MNVEGMYINAEASDIIKELREQLLSQDVSLFGKYFDSGEDLMICCPYHKNGQERRPSAGIRKSDGMFHCFACGETHSLPEMISHCFGQDNKFGYKWLIDNFVITRVEDRHIDLDIGREPKKKIEFKQATVSEEELDSYRYIHPYMYKRGLTDDIIDIFDIGYDKRTDSITFPVKDRRGNCVFVARRSVKYKSFNIPKGVDKPLYGLYEVYDHELLSTACGKVYVCEGLFDCLRLWCNGKVAVAGFGCLFSDNQITLLKELPTRTLVLALDNDIPGQVATEKLRKKISNKIITQVVLPKGRKDIGECTDEEIQNLEEVLV